MGQLAFTTYASAAALLAHVHELGQFTGEGTSNDPFLEDLQGLLAIVQGSWSSSSSSQKA
jgi:hypothetical protein